MSVIVSLMGGLGFFLYGMKLMSEGLQKVAGSKMRSILEVFTKNRVIGLLVGIFFTALIQSSNATTVMVVSFVNSGLMKLAQAPGIILGANIGTTVTGQLIAFDLADIAPLFVIIGVLMVMFVKNNLTISRLGEVILGFGILFMGISGISGALNEAKEIPAVVNALGSLTNPFLAFLVGWVATAILQSNSATVGIIMLLAREGLMGLPICLFMMLGCNIGCTMSAILASFGCKKDAKRAACVHLLFNISGTIVCSIIFLLFGKQVVDSLWVFRKRSRPYDRKCKLDHQRLLMLPFVVKATYFIIRGNDEEDKKFERFLKHAMSPTTAVLQAVREMERMAQMAETNLIRAMNTLVTRESNSATVGIIMLLAREGLMGLPICLFMMLGCNIGCTMSAILASFGCKKDAKRAACVHLLFNISGTIVCSIIFLLFGKQVVDFFMGISGNEAGRMIANANSIIKVCQVLLMLPFTPLLVKATYFIIRGNDEEDKKFELAYISSKHAMSPTTAVLQAVREMERMAQMAETNLIRAMNTLVTRDQKEIDEVYRVEENINFLNKEITNYLVHLNQASLPTSDVMRIGALFHVVNDIERIGDHAENVADSAVQMTNDNVTFSKQGELDLSEMLDMVLKILDESIEMFAKNDLQHLQEIIDIENSIDQEERDLQQKHVERLTRNECTPEAGMIFSDLVSGLERVADHATNIAFSILDEDPEEKAAREAVAGAEK